MTPAQAVALTAELRTNPHTRDALYTQIAAVLADALRETQAALDEIYAGRFPALAQEIAARAATERARTALPLMQGHTVTCGAPVAPCTCRP